MVPFCDAFLYVCSLLLLKALRRTTALWEMNGDECSLLVLRFTSLDWSLTLYWALEWNSIGQMELPAAETRAK